MKSRHKRLLFFTVPALVVVAMFAALLAVKWFEGDFARGAITRRPLNKLSGDFPPGTGGPGGTLIPGSQDPNVNCAGSACLRNEWINWPKTAAVYDDTSIDTAWEQAVSFLPRGCVRTSCAGVSISTTRCQPGETELINYVYRWPEKHPQTGQTIWKIGFHMVGRDLPGAGPDGHSYAIPWHSKKDARELCADITDADQSLYDSYPRVVSRPETEIEKLCFCCSGCSTTETQPR